MPHDLRAQLGAVFRVERVSRVFIRDRWFSESSGFLRAYDLRRRENQNCLIGSFTYRDLFGEPHERPVCLPASAFLDALAGAWASPGVYRPRPRADLAHGAGARCRWSRSLNQSSRWRRRTPVIVSCADRLKTRRR